MKFSKSKIFSGLIGCVILSVSAASASSVFEQVTDKIKTDETSIETKFDLNLKVIDGKIARTFLINPNATGQNAIINEDNGNGFLAVNILGEVIDNFEDVVQKMKSRYVEFDTTSDKHQVPKFISGGHFLGDNTVLFSSNYDSKNWEGSLWSINLNTREINKIINSTDTGNLSFLHVDNERALVYGEKENKVIEIDRDINFKEYELNGHILSVSPDGEKIVYQIFENEGSLSNNIAFYNLKTNQVLKTKHDLDEFYNSGGNWNQSGSHFVYLKFNKLDLLNPTAVVFDVNENLTYEIKSDFDNNFSSETNSISFVDQNTIEIILDNASSIQYKIN